MSARSGNPKSHWESQLQTATNPEARYQALGMLVRNCTHEELLPWLKLGLQNADPSVQALSVKQLGSFPVQAEYVPALVAGLSAADPDIQFESARTLVRWQQPSAAILEILLRFLDDSETQPLMLAAVVELLGTFSDSAEILLPKLRGLLGHPQTEVRENSLRSLGQLGVAASESVPEILPLLDDDEPFVREYAALALGQIGIWNSAVKAGLRAAAEDEDSQVAEIATAALEKLQPPE